MITHPTCHYRNGGISPFRRCILILSFCMCCLTHAFGQFAPVAGSPGTTAIPYDSSAIVAWATGCSVQRGYRDIAVPDSGFASAGDSSAAIGSATQNGTVSLGDGGIATLTFDQPITNGPGFDFAIFENGFTLGGSGMAFLELAFVEVSSDGIRYVRFPTADNVQDTTQIGSFGTMDGSRLNNLAGKYVYGYGTPFDLDDVRDSAGLDVNNITHIRVIDVIGTLDSTYATHDSRGYRINDPYPTNYASSGFDLDAVGVIHQKTVNSITDLKSDALKVYPNPTSGYVNVQTQSIGISGLILTDPSGRTFQSSSFEKQTRLDISALPAGVYMLQVTGQDHVSSLLIGKE